MATLALACYALYLALAFGLRTLLQVRRTGSTGFHGIGGRPGSAEWSAGVLFTVALIVGAAAPVLALAGAVEPLGALDGPAAHVAGAALFAAGLGATLAAQLAMGPSWRIGVDPDERSGLPSISSIALDLLAEGLLGDVQAGRRAGDATTLGWPVGFWAAELMHPFHEFTKARYEITVCSPEGGKVEMDALSDPRDGRARCSSSATTRTSSA